MSVYAYGLIHLHCDKFINVNEGLLANAIREPAALPNTLR